VVALGGAAGGHLAGILTVDLDTRTVLATFEADVGLRDLLGRLPDGSQAVAAWIPNIGLQEADIEFSYDSAHESLVAYIQAGIAGSPSNSASLLIATVELPPSPATGYLVGVGLRSTADLSGTPLFGSMLSGITIQNLGVQYASQDLPAGSVVIPRNPPTKLPAVKAGLALTLTIAGGGAEKTFSLEPSTKKPPNTPPSQQVLLLRDGDGDRDDGGGPPMQWFSLQQTFGPLTLGRLGILTSDDRFGLGLDASVQTTAFSVVLTGFMISFPTDRIDLADTHVQLDGLALSFSSPSVSIDGSLVRATANGITSYDGAVLIQLGQFGIAAVGSYADLHGSASLFIYGMAKGAFGGPPAFFVTGIAAGFGYNRRLRLPTPETVADHPFVLATQDGAGFTQALQQLTTGGWIPPEVGQYWLAAGVQFTTFELMKSFVLLSVQFGNELVFALLGVSTITLPQAGPTYARAELTLDAVLRPAAGTFQVTALLTANSYVLDPACHLTGGFAFWLWFGSNEHAGDFVVTLGGYHPLFDPPPWYPTIPRLGFDWNVSDTVHFTGGVYFALTPSCVMAGGSLALTYHSGDLRAWFTAHVDMIVYWKPFYFIAGIGLSLGASYTLNLGTLHRTFTVELGVDLELWGPPVAGIATVNWFIISFTVEINGGGKPNRPGGTLKDWDTFAASFLPGGGPPPSPPALAAAAAPSSAPDTPSTICRPRATRGLLRTIENDTVWVIAASDFVLETETVVPATEIVVGDEKQPAHHFKGPAAGVYPLGSVDLQATHLVGIARVTDQGDEPLNLASWTWAPTTGSQPGSLWDPKNSGKAKLGADTVPVLTGSTGAPTPVELSGPGPISFTDLKYAPLADRTLPLPTSAPIDGSTTATIDPFAAVQRTVMDPGVITTRDAVVAELLRVGVGGSLTGGDLTVLRDDIEATFAAPPMIGTLGATGPKADDAAGPSVRRVAAPTGSPAWRRPRPPAPGPRLRAGFRRQPARTGAGAPGDEIGARLWNAVVAPAPTHRPLPCPGSRRGLSGHAARRAGGASRMIAADTTAVWALDPAGSHRVELRGPRRRVLALDEQDHVVLDALVVDGLLALPAGTATVVLAADRRAPDDRQPVGWSRTDGLRPVGPHAALGTGVLVRTQAPLTDVRSAAALVAANRVLGAGDETRAGWTATLVSGAMRTALISVDGDGPLPVVQLAWGHRPRSGDLVAVTTPVATLDDADGRHLLVALDAGPRARTGEPCHVFVTTTGGVSLRGVAAFAEAPARLLADGPAIDAGGTEPLAGPTFVRWLMTNGGSW
jgi:hypothetical protein